MVDQLRPVMRPRLYEVIVEQLCSHIADNEMVAGDRLPPERELAAKLGVSRASLSQALVAHLNGEKVEARIPTGEVLATQENLDHPDVRELLEPGQAQ